MGKLYSLISKRIILLLAFLGPTFAYCQGWLDYYNQSLASYKAGEYQKSYEEITKSAQFYLTESGAANDNYAAVLRHYGNVCFVLERYDEGIGQIKKEIEIRSVNEDAKLADARLNLAEFYKQQGEFDQAIEQIKLSEKILAHYYQPTDSELIACRLNLGVTYYYANDQKGSLEILQTQLVSIDEISLTAEEDIRALYIYGLLLSQSGNKTLAIQALEKAKTLWESIDNADDEQQVDLLYNLGQLYHQTNQWQVAEKTYSTAISLAESNEVKDEIILNLKNARAINLQAMGNESEAQKIFSSIESQSLSGNTYATSLSNRAAFYQGKGDWAQAEKFYTEALSKFDQSDKAGKLLYADAESNLAILKSEQGDFEGSIKMLLQARQTYIEQSSKEGTGYITILNKLGSTYLKAGKTELAYEALSESMAQSNIISEGSLLSMQALTGIGSVYYQEGKIVQADSAFSAVIETYERNSWRYDVNYLSALNNLASVKQMQAQYKDSRDLVYKMSNVASGIYGRESVLYASILNIRATLDMNMGTVASAKIAIDSADYLYKKSGATETTDYAQLLASRAKYYLMLGNYNLAEPEYRKASDIIRKNKGPQSIEYAQILNSQALLLQTLGNYTDAEKLLQQSKTITESARGKNNTEYSTALQNLATLMQLQGKFTQAEKMLEEAQTIDRAVLGEMHPLYAVLIQNLAALYQKTGRSADAENLLNAALKNYEYNFGKNNASYATTLANLASLYQDQNKWSLAETTWNECLSIRKNLVGEEHPDYARAQMGLAGLYHAQARYGEAVKMYDPLIKNYQRQVKDFFPSMSEREKTAFFAKVKSAFDSYIDFAMEYALADNSKKSELMVSVYNIQLVNKAILLSTSSKIRSKILNSNDAQLLSQYQEWLRTKELILKWYTQFTIAEREMTDVKELEKTANDLEKELSLKSTLFKGEVDVNTVNFEEVKNVLTNEEAAIELIRITKRYVKDSVYYLGLIAKKGFTAPEPVVFAYGNKLENRYFKYLRNSVRFSLADSISYNLFWQPIANQLKDTRVVYISCDGVFNKVNFNVLKKIQSDQYVLDEWLIRRLSNTRELVEIKNSNTINKKLNSATLIGYADFNLSQADVIREDEKRSVAHQYGFESEEIPVLPATQKEVEILGSLMEQRQWRVNKLMQENATEDNLKSDAGNSVLHIATHGFFLEDVNTENLADEDDFLSNPLFQSGILLSGASVPSGKRNGMEDGVLTAYEAMNLNLENTELVALSACETGLGTIQNGEGVFGLQRSFLMAGANTLLMSLWQVDDAATQQLMVDFYTFWLSGTEKHEAFRQAQLKNKQHYNDPYYWGGFIMIGK